MEQLESELKIPIDTKQDGSNSTSSEVEVFFFNKLKFESEKEAEISKNIHTKTPVDFKNIELSPRHHRKPSKSPRANKSRSPNNQKKKMLAEETTTLSAAIKQKIDNLLQVSENIKTYEYSSTSKDKNRAK